MTSEAPHPYFSRLCEHAAAMPDAQEDHPWGEVVYKVRGKIFAFLGHAHQAVVTLKPEPEEREALLALPFVDVAPYVGRYGWLTLRVEDEEALALALDLIDASYAQVARKAGRKKTA